PVLAQLWIAQHGSDDGCAVGWRIAIVGADADANLRQSPLRGFAAGCDQRQCADALAVEAEILGEGAADEELARRLCQLAQAGSVFDDPVAKALIRKINERQETALMD